MKPNEFVPEMRITLDHVLRRVGKRAANFADRGLRDEPHSARRERDRRAGG